MLCMLYVVFQYNSCIDLHNIYSYRWVVRFAASYESNNVELLIFPKSVQWRITIKYTAQIVSSSRPAELKIYKLDSSGASTMDSLDSQIW